MWAGTLVWWDNVLLLGELISQCDRNQCPGGRANPALSVPSLALERHSMDAEALLGHQEPCPHTRTETCNKRDRRLQ